MYAYIYICIYTYICVSIHQAVEDLETREVGIYDDRILSLVDDLMLEAWPAPFKGAPS